MDFKFQLKDFVGFQVALHRAIHNIDYSDLKELGINSRVGRLPKQITQNSPTFVAVQLHVGCEHFASSDEWVVELQRQKYHGMLE